MASYRIYMVDDKGSRQPATDANCVSDKEALALAQRMIAKPEATAEVWCGERLVGNVSPVTAAEINGFAWPYGPSRPKD